jgi:hypothetical protein
MKNWCIFLIYNVSRGSLLAGTSFNAEYVLLRSAFSLSININ